MDVLNRLLAIFEKIAPHLRNELVLIGFLCLLFVSYAALVANPILGFILTLIVVLGLLGVRFLKLRQRQLPESDRGNDEVDIRIARKLAELADHFEGQRSTVSYYLRNEARRILIFANRPDLASDVQPQLDEAIRPPKEPDPSE